MPSKSFVSVKPELAGATIQSAFHRSSNLDVDVILVDKAVKEIRLKFDHREIVIVTPSFTSIEVLAQVCDEQTKLTAPPNEVSL